MDWPEERKARRLLKLAGIKPLSTDKEATMALKGAVTDCWPWIEPYGASLLWIFVFDSYAYYEQTGKLSVGLCAVHPGKVATIGLSLGVVRQGGDTLRAVLLHELTHLKHTGHGAGFRRALAGLTAEYNQKHNAKIKAIVDIDPDLS